MKIYMKIEIYRYIYVYMYMYINRYIDIYIYVCVWVCSGKPDIYRLMIFISDSISSFLWRLVSKVSTFIA